MFRDDFVVFLTINGKTLREDGDRIIIPFGSDYTINFKNLSNKRAKAWVKVDGEDVLEGTSLVVGPFKTVSLEGFRKNGAVHNKFRFIEKTQQISNYRGDNPEDGIISVEFAFEQEFNTPIIPSHDIWGNNIRSKDLDIYNENTNVIWGQPIGDYQVTCQAKPDQYLNNLNAEGITVPGVETSQNFVSVADFWTGAKQVINIKLVGHINKDPIKTPVFARERITCRTCGTINKSINKFCGNCGTFLL